MLLQLWALPALTPGLVLRGHKRGVWACAFAPLDKVRSAAACWTGPATLCCNNRL